MPAVLGDTGGELAGAVVGPADEVGDEGAGAGFDVGDKLTTGKCGWRALVPPLHPVTPTARQPTAATMIPTLIFSE